MRGAFHRSECVQKEQGFCAFPGKLLDALLQFGDLRGITIGQIGLFRWILWNVVQLNGGRRGVLQMSFQSSIRTPPRNGSTL